MPVPLSAFFNKGKHVTDSNSFRQETRDWLEANCPESMRHPYRNEADACWGGRNCKFQSEDQQNWLESMAARGWTVPTWPVEYGGGGLDGAQAKILKEELLPHQGTSADGKFWCFDAGPAAIEIWQRGTQTTTPAADRPR